MKRASQLFRLHPRPSPHPELREFLLAQLAWERYHATRVLLVHAAAVGGLCLWFLDAFGGAVPKPLHAVVLAPWALCFVGSGLAAIMERHWSLRRRRFADPLGPSDGGTP